MQDHILQELIELRHTLHQFPELSGQEIQTASRIAAFVNKYRPDALYENLGGTGLAAVFDSNSPGPTLMLRCELDALPIVEQNNLSYKSTLTGVSHKCGHDGHMTMIAGIANWLSTKPLDRGRVVLLFQPAEETGKGAPGVLEDSRFSEIIPDYIIALHNLPGYRMHEIIWIKGQFSSTVQSVAISLTGKKSHSAEPEKGINPALAIAELIQFAVKNQQPNPNQKDFCLLTPIYSTLGQKDYGISAGYGELHFTLRCWTTERMEEMVQQLDRKLKEIRQEHQLQIKTDWFDYFPSVINNETCNAIIREAALQQALNLVESPIPCKFGEDFGWFSQKYPGAMFGLGAGIKTPPLHNDTYDFPDELIETGVHLFQQIIIETLNS